MRKDLIRLDDFEYQGFYRFPKWRPDNMKFGYGTQAATWSHDRDTLFVAGYGHSHKIAELRIPESEGGPPTMDGTHRLEIVQDLTDPAPELADEKAENILDRLGGIAEVRREGRFPLRTATCLALTYHRYYAVGDPSKIDAPTLADRNLDLSLPGPKVLRHIGPTGTWPYHQKRTANYCCEIPERWRPSFNGHPLAVGKGDGPGNSGNSHGPTLFSTTVGGIGDTDARVLLNYDKHHEIENWQPSDSWEGAVWLDWQGRHGVLFVGTRGIGPSWYGPTTDPKTGAKDKCRTGKGYHSPSYSAEFRFYDPWTLAEVSRGEIDSWAPKPYDVRQVALSTSCKRVGGIAWDGKRGRLFVCEVFGEDPRLHVWQIKDDEPEPEPEPETVTVSVTVKGRRFEGDIEATDE